MSDVATFWLNVTKKIKFEKQMFNECIVKKKIKNTSTGNIHNFKIIKNHESNESYCLEFPQDAEN